MVLEYFIMWVFWPVVKLFNYLRVLMMKTKKSLDLFFGKLDSVTVDFSIPLCVESREKPHIFLKGLGVLHKLSFNNSAEVGDLMKKK